MPVYNYQPNVPMPNQQKNQSQPILNQNFYSIQSTFDINHADFNNANYGKHNVVQMPVQAGAQYSPPTGVTVVAGETLMYNLAFTISTQNETWLQVNSSAGAYQIPFTASIFGTNANPPPVNTIGSGWCYLPCGLIMKWGTFSAAPPAPAYLFPTGSNIPVFTTTVLSLQLTAGNSSGVGNVQSVIYLYNTVSATGFNYFIYNNTVNSQITYMAIGY